MNDVLVGAISSIVGRHAQRPRKAFNGLANRQRSPGAEDRGVEAAPGLARQHRQHQRGDVVDMGCVVEGAVEMEGADRFAGAQP